MIFQLKKSILLVTSRLSNCRQSCTSLSSLLPYYVSSSNHPRQSSCPQSFAFVVMYATGLVLVVSIRQPTIIFTLVWYAPQYIISFVNGSKIIMCLLRLICVWVEQLSQVGKCALTCSYQVQRQQKMLEADTEGTHINFAPCI